MVIKCITQSITRTKKKSKLTGGNEALLSNKDIQNGSFNTNRSTSI